MPLNVFIAGQKAFGATVYKELKAKGHNILGVACPSGGKYYDPLKKMAYCDSRRPIIIDEERLVATDIPADTHVLIAAHAHHFINARVRGCVPYAIGYHPSLLPRHRGRDAVKWTIRFGDTIAGGTAYLLDDKVDGGPVLRQQAVFVDRGWGYKELWRKALFPLGIGLITETLQDIEAGRVAPVPQDERFATWEPAIENRRIHRTGLLMVGGG